MQSLHQKTPNLHVLGYELPEGMEIFRDIERLVWRVRNAVKATEESRVVVAVDGPPGGGKGHKSPYITDELRPPPYGTIEYGMDKHLGTAPDTPARAMLHESDAAFDKLYCNDQRAAEVVRELLDAPAGSQVHPGRVYSRDDRGFIEGAPITIPEGNQRVVILEGTGSTGIAERTGEPVVPVFIFTELITAWRAKMLRDRKRGITERPDFHKIDIEMAARLRGLVKTLQRDDLILLDNTANLEAVIAEATVATAVA
jgi:hypothetical protein